MNICQSFDFDSVATGLPTFLGFYSRRKSNGEKETWEEACDRFLQGLRDLGDFSKEEFSLISKYARTAKSLPSGRWMWTGGSSWLNEKKNVFGAYNCTSLNLTGVEVFGTLMELSMMGCGTGAVLDPGYIKLLPVIKNPIAVYFTGSFGSIPKNRRKEASEMRVDFDNRVTITVGDSREGWVRSYQLLLQLASSHNFDGKIVVTIDISHVRESGEALEGFGGVANPIKLKEMYSKCASILNGAIGRQLDSLECCLLIDEGSAAVVAGNIRRSAGMRQFNSDDTNGLTAKDNLWSQDADGRWIIDPKRDSLRMANHSRVFHCKPTLEECFDSVKKQYFSSEGAIQNAAEAIARSNADILKNKTAKLEFLKAYEEDRSPRGKAATVLDKYCCQELGYSLFDRLHEEELYHRFARFGLNPCGEITGTDFTCNLSEIHLNQLDPTNFQEQEEAFTVGALSVSALLKHEFPVPVMQRSRELDPIVGVSFTGAFDFFVNALGVDWLRWWQKDRCQFFYGGIDTKIIQICAKFNIDLEYYRRDEQYQLGMLFEAIEKAYLSWWQSIVFKVVAAYCDRHKLKCPNRCTTVQPSGTKSLLTGASPGWHPPKAQRYIRRITYTANHPVALACRDFGYNIIPAQSSKDENGMLLDNIHDPRCTEWLVEIPVSMPWADLPGAADIDVSQFSAIAQFDFYMRVQQEWTTHNTSATIEFREPEIPALSLRIHDAIKNNEGFISVALMARFDDYESFPSLPFEPISKETYEQMMSDVLKRRITNDFYATFTKYDLESRGMLIPAGPNGCDGDKCEMPKISPA